MSLVIKEEIAKLLLDNNAVTLNAKKPYTFVSGIKSPIYTDNRLLIGIPHARREVVNCLMFLMKEYGIKADVIAGTATAGIPWAALLAERLNLPMVYVRSEKKEHGKGNQIEGKLEPGSNVVVVEDLISSGKSSIETVNALRESGCYVTNCVAIFTYGMKKADDAFKNAGVKLFTLTDFATVVDIAAKNDILDDDEKEIVLGWAKDPDSWGRKAGVE